MNNKHVAFTVRRTVVIASGALFFLFAFAAVAEPLVPEESELTELTRPKSTIEAGVGGVTDSNWKFGQYNGLNNSGAYGIGNFDIRGGGAYDSSDATRWRITGKNIGLENRSFTGEYKDQGKYKLDFGYDEIPMNLNNSFQTPYLGTGGADLILPGNWQYPTNNNMRTLPASDYSVFHTINMGTKRERIDGGFSYFFNPQWEAQASMRHENKNGTQPLGAPIVGVRAVILPNPISQSTDQINASMKYTGDKGYGQFAYYGSLFHNDINGVTFQNPFGAPIGNVPAFGRMSSMPDNQFHQFSLTGGYNFSPATKLVANGAYARNWQNQDFLPYNTSVNGGGTLPTSNLNGDVETKAVNLKLTHKVNKDLNFASAYKYDERDNHTPINEYIFFDADGLGVTGTPTERSNTPYSKRIQQGNLGANYSFAQGHWLKAGYELQNIDRWCNRTWISCADTPTTTENTGRLDYRGSFFDRINSKLGYAYSYRSADNYNQDNALWAKLPQDAALYNRIAATGLPAWGPALPWAAPGDALNQAVFPNNNPASVDGDINGLRRFNTANRERQKVNAYVDYQVTNKLSMGVGGDFRYDNYPNSRFGLQSSRNWGINLDSSYAFNEDTSVQLFYSYQDIVNKSAGMSYPLGATPNTNVGSILPGTVVGGCVNNVRAMNNTGKTDPCRNWFTDMTDNIDTVGFGVKRKGFLDGKLDVNGDFLYSFARTLIGVTGGQYVQSPTGTPANGPFLFIPAANMPTVKTEMYQFKLDAKYIINKPSAVHLSYLYQYLFSSDYIYTGMQLSGTPQALMPTFEQAPTYSIHAVGLSYIYNF
jgi:MtrB/PioB family decaheme-associated outer membrane protein